MKGLATGLLYLHEEWEMVVVHRDLKPSNVMLDGEWNARLGDFGLARLLEGGVEGLETRSVAGTPGYMAPECIETMVTREADVYSFGAVAMEVATGRRPSWQLTRWLWSLHEENHLLEAVDPRLATYDVAEMERLLILGLAYCHPDPACRPSISQVLHSLSTSSAAPLQPLPPPHSTPLSFFLSSPSSNLDSYCYSSSSSSGAPTLIDSVAGNLSTQMDWPR